MIKKPPSKSIEDEEDLDVIPEGEPLTAKEFRELRKQVPLAERTSEQQRQALKRKVRMLYDLQRIRIQIAGRGQTKAETITLHPVDVAILNGRAKEIMAQERAAERDVNDHLLTLPIGRYLLERRSEFKGLGVRMIGVIVAELTIERHETISKMWAYAGLKPVPALRCRHCQDIVAQNKDGTYKHAYNREVKCPVALQSSDVLESTRAQHPVKGEKLPYNAWLRTKLLGVLAPCLIKANSPWRLFYDQYKHRKKSDGWGMSDGHRDRAAQRYMVKMLLAEIWRVWRTMEGLPVRVPYQEEYLQHKHTA